MWVGNGVSDKEGLIIFIIYHYGDYTKIRRIINLAVGGNWPGNPHHENYVNQKLIVDYVRVFEKIK